MPKKRLEIAKEDRWQVEALYSSLDLWEKDLKDLLSQSTKNIRWPEMTNLKGTLRKGVANLKELLDKMFFIERKLVKLYTYAHLRHDEDLANQKYKEVYDRITLVYFDFQKETAWVQPEILQLEKEAFASYLDAKELEPYRCFLHQLFVLKPYTLTPDQEHLIALASQALSASAKTFTVFNNADLVFGSVKDEKGDEHTLSHGTYLLYLKSGDRTLRKNAFKGYLNQYAKYENTLAETINGHIQNHIFESRARGYDSCLHAALIPYQIDIQVYHNLIETVRQNLSVLHRYMRLRKKILNLDEMHFYDIHTPLFPSADQHYSAQEAKEIVLKSVRPLGAEYQAILEKGLNKERWVDWYENTQKRAGAYSSGCYDSHPYILMNYHGTLRDLMTLTHEGGHSMHSYYSNLNQPYQYAQYSIFVAEVASTFNEELLFRYLLEKANTKKEKAYLINQKLDDIRATLFRQTQFAEFELILHNLAENGVPLTTSNIKEKYRSLISVYYGPDFIIDDEIDVECLMVPHFYAQFYVYQYATGISAANILADSVFKEGVKARERYLKFLSSGCSQYPVKLLQLAGVDMCIPDPIVALIKRFDHLISELELLNL